MAQSGDLWRTKNVFTRLILLQFSEIRLMGTNCTLMEELFYAIPTFSRAIASPRGHLSGHNTGIIEGLLAGRKHHIVRDVKSNLSLSVYFFTLFIPN